MLVSHVSHVYHVSRVSHVSHVSHVSCIMMYLCWLPLYKEQPEGMPNALLILSFYLFLSTKEIM